MNPIHWLSTEVQGQSFTQLGELALALLLSSLNGLEREIAHAGIKIRLRQCHRCESNRS
jgi:hypothetical protein